VNSTANAVLIDFGISVVIQEPDRQRELARMGTEAWQAPELHQDLLSDMNPLQTIASEVWSLGVLIFEVRRLVLSRLWRHILTGTGLHGRASLS
jgi:serine/threonine protein kinase